MKKSLAFALALVALCAGCALASVSAMDKDTLIVGLESTFRPFEFRNEKGELAGFDIDLVNAVGNKIGKKIQFVDMAFDGLIPALMTNKIDIIASGMSATPKRAERISFTKSYYTAPDGVVTKADSSIHKADDLAGRIVAVQLGTIQDTLMTAWQKTKGIKDVKRYQKTDDAMREVLLGRVDAACFDGTVCKETLNNTKEFTKALHIAFKVETSKNGMAMGISKKDPQLLKSVNDALLAFMAEGGIKDLKSKWKVD